MAMDTVDQLDNLLKDQPEHCLRPRQREDIEDEASRLRTVVEAPDWQAGQAKGAARQRYGQIMRMLAEQSAHPIDEPMRRDQVDKLHREVLEDVIKPAMLTRAEMRRNPAGAVSEFMRRENSAPIQRAIRVWKKARFALDPNTDNEDHANIELHRREGMPWNGAASFMADAQIPGKFAMSPLAKENWPLPEPQNTAIAQVQRREAPQRNAPKPKRTMSEAQKAALARGRARKRAAQVQVTAEAAAVTAEAV